MLDNTIPPAIQAYLDQLETVDFENYKDRTDGLDLMACSVHVLSLIPAAPFFIKISDIRRARLNHKDCEVQTINEIHQDLQHCLDTMLSIDLIDYGVYKNTKVCWKK